MSACVTAPEHCWWPGTLAQTDNRISRGVELPRAATQAPRPRPALEPGAPREGTKQEAVLTLLRRPQGATMLQIMGVTGWQQHTIRDFFAGLKKRRGIRITALERLQQVGLGGQGSRCSYSIHAR